MPELPEVQTTVDGLQSRVLNRTLVGIWTDWKKMVKRPKDFALFERELKGKKILRVWRRAKNVIMDLSGGYSLLIHMKMTGHLMVGVWVEEGAKWVPKERGPLDEKINTYLHFILLLDNGEQIALSDLRKFAKVELWKTQELLDSKEFASWGPEPLEPGFTFELFKKCLERRKGKIKQAIMNHTVIAGVGNIYASEALWHAKIHPEKNVHKLSEKELRLLYGAIKKALKAGIDFGGDSFSDYRDVNGQKGKFEGHKKVYQREGLPCTRCKTPIKRIMFGGRSAFYCPTCQKLK